MTIKAIETEYGGVMFRSRLEARWAVFFDALGVSWQYEPEGFEYEQWRYLPDFYLPEFGTYVEVKGDAAAVTDDYLYMLGSAGHLLPGVHNAAGTTRGLLLLGDVPRMAGPNVYHVHLTHWKGLQVQAWSWGAQDASAGVDTSAPYLRDLQLTVDRGDGRWYGSSNLPEFALIDCKERPHLWEARLSDYWTIATPTFRAYQVARGYRFWNPRAA